MKGWIVLHRFRMGLVAVLLTVAVVFGWLYTRIPQTESRELVPFELDLNWPNPTAFTPGMFSAFQGEATTGNSSALAERYRLAGTFTAASVEESSRMAVIDNLASGEQYLVEENESFEGIEVQEIYPERVVLLCRGKQETLWKSNAAPAPLERRVKTEQQPEVTTWAERPALETNRFGKRVSENQWVLKREELLKYQQELMDDPERLANLYLSFKTAKTGRKTEGFDVLMTGEQEFLGMMSLQKGDRIKRVNSMRMISQRRAEMFVREFAKDRLQSVIMDVERDGEVVQNVFIIQ